MNAIRAFDNSQEAPIREAPIQIRRLGGYAVCVDTLGYIPGVGTVVGALRAITGVAIGIIGLVTLISLGALGKVDKDSYPLSMRIKFVTIRALNEMERGLYELIPFVILIVDENRNKLEKAGKRRATTEAHGECIYQFPNGRLLYKNDHELTEPFPVLAGDTPENLAGTSPVLDPIPVVEATIVPQINQDDGSISSTDSEIDPVEQLPVEQLPVATEVVAAP